MPTDLTDRFIPRPSLILSEEELRTAVDLLLREDYFVVDVETDGLDFILNDVMWVGLAAPGLRYLIPLSHPNGHLLEPAQVKEVPDMSTVRPYKRNPSMFTKPKMQKVHTPAVFSAPPEQIRPDRAFAIMEPLFFSDLTKVGHNLKFDLKSIAKYYGRIPTGPYADTIILMHLLDENRATYGLKDITTSWLLGIAAQNPDVRKRFYPELGKGGIANFSIDDIGTYLQRDITYTLWLYKRFLPTLSETLASVFTFEMDVYRVLMQVEYDGIKVDPDSIAALSKLVDDEISVLSTDIWKICGEVFELTNVDRRKHFLFSSKEEGGQGLTPKGFTKTGKAKLDKSSLSEFAETNELARLFFEYTERAKLKSSFVDPYQEEFIHSRTKRTHAGFKQHGTATGRLSSSEPNLQQIPAHSELGKEFRRCFIPESGGKLIVADYDQIELRAIAYHSQDPEMMRLFREGEDVHRNAAAAMFGLEPDEITPDQRSIGKTFNFAVGYGAMPSKLATITGLPLKTCEELIERYFARFSRLVPWKQEIVAEAVKHGNRLDPNNFPPYVAIPPFGRKRRLPDLFSDDNYAVMRAQRQAVNAVIQGFASYVMKIATLQLAAALKDTSARIVAQVHDEMVVEVLDQTEVDDVYRLVIDSMEQVFIEGKPVFGSVPLIASGGIGDNWVEAKV